MPKRIKARAEKLRCFIKCFQENRMVDTDTPLFYNLVLISQLYDDNYECIARLSEEMKRIKSDPYTKHDMAELRNRRNDFIRVEKHLNDASAIYRDILKIRVKVKGLYYETKKI